MRCRAHGVDGEDVHGKVDTLGRARRGIVVAVAAKYRDPHRCTAGRRPDAVERGETITIVRGNHPVAEIGPAHRRTGADLRAALADVPPPDDEFGQAIAAAVAMVTSEVRDPWADA
jgi:antitoxin (DNA-binding transcriptional repressor) of toxin-antitoxin stability system